MTLTARKKQCRRANAKAAAVCRRRLFHSTGMGRLSTELILALLGDYSTREILKVRGSTRELCRIASMDPLWAPGPHGEPSTQRLRRRSFEDWLPGAEPWQLVIFSGRADALDLHSRSAVLLTSAKRAASASKSSSRNSLLQTSKPPIHYWKHDLTE